MTGTFPSSAPSSPPESLRDLAAAATLIVEIGRTEQTHEESPYSSRRTHGPFASDSPERDGRGGEVVVTGMTWSGFRPSDDRCRHGYLVPANALASVSLHALAEIAAEVLGAPGLAADCRSLANEIDAGIARHALVSPDGVKVLAKTEAWVLLEAAPGAVVGLGLRRPVAPEELADMVRRHDSAGLVEAVNTRTVRPGDGILVPAGTPHFIGEGVFVLELQEPTDLSILLEWEGLAVDGDRDGHLDLGYDVALQAVDLTGERSRPGSGRAVTPSLAAPRRQSRASPTSAASAVRAG
jgi:hypothetical protein